MNEYGEKYTFENSTYLKNNQNFHLVCNFFGIFSYAQAPKICCSFRYARDKSVPVLSGRLLLNTLTAQLLVLDRRSSFQNLSVAKPQNVYEKSFRDRCFQFYFHSLPKTLPCVRTFVPENRRSS